MPDLLDKLNVLMRSRLNSLLENATAQPTRSGRARRDIESDVSTLRKQIDEALAAEDSMKAKIESLGVQADALSKQADAALLNHDEPRAKGLQQQQNQIEKQISVMQADLKQHQQATSELIEHVNVLDSTLIDKQRDQPTVSENPGDDRDQDQRAATVANTQTVTSMPPMSDDGSIPIKINIKKEAPAQESPETDNADDLAARRARLSKPD